MIKKKKNEFYTILMMKNGCGSPILVPKAWISTLVTKNSAPHCARASRYAEVSPKTQQKSDLKVNMQTRARSAESGARSATRQRKFQQQRRRACSLARGARIPARGARTGREFHQICILETNCMPFFWSSLTPSPWAPKTQQKPSINTV